mmetsp:Transcript_77702/g.166591  ORF Transcript_77702/g.166591 Transcript_77702/m.166591 type:complete len:193 (-) Transcript_77702:37-615(-)
MASSKSAGRPHPPVVAGELEKIDRCSRFAPCDLGLQELPVLPVVVDLATFDVPGRTGKAGGRARAFAAAATAAADGQPTSAAAAPERMAAEQLPTGHTLRPREMGQHVAVVGDGWGGGTGGYEAVITEADELTFTVIAISGEARWKETHVLRQCCIAVSSGSGGEADGDSERPAGKVSPTVVGAAKRPRLRQ